MKVTRRVDTIIVEMDIDVAEKVQSILSKTYDTTTSYGGLTELAIGMARHGIDGTHYVAEMPDGKGLVRIQPYYGD